MMLGLSRDTLLHLACSALIVTALAHVVPLRWAALVALCAGEAWERVRYHRRGIAIENTDLLADLAGAVLAVAFVWLTRALA